MPALGPRHQRVRRLRDLIRDPRARRAEHAFVVEGPRVLAAALDRSAELESAYVGPGAGRAFAPLIARLRDLDIPIEELKDGVLERIGDTVTPQPVLAVAAMPRTDLDDVRADGLVLVAVMVQDPGNAGTLLRSGEAAGAAGVLFCGNSVDPHAPKVVRSSGGAVFGIPVVEADDPVKVLDALGRHGRRRLAAVAGIVTPDTILRWYRRLVAKKYDGSKTRRPVARAESRTSPRSWCACPPRTRPGATHASAAG